MCVCIFSEAESQVIQWNIDCRFGGKRYLAEIPSKEAWKYQDPKLIFSSGNGLNDNIMILQVPSVSEHHAGVVWPRSRCLDCCW